MKKKKAYEREDEEMGVSEPVECDDSDEEFWDTLANNHDDEEGR